MLSHTMKRFRFRIHHLSVQMTVYYSVVILTAFFALALLISNLFAEQLLKEMDDVLGRKIRLMDTELKSSLTQIQSLHMAIINDNTLRNNMIEISRTGVDATSMAAVQSRLTNIASQASYIASIVAFDQDQNIIHSYYSLPPYSKLVARSEDFKQFCISSRTRSFTRPNSFPVAMGPEDDSSITYLGNLYDPIEYYTTLGTVAINLKSSFLFSALDTLAADSFDACFLTDQTGAVIYKTGRGTYSQMSPEEVNQDFRVYATPVSGYPEWTLTCVLTEKNFRSGLEDLNKVVLSMCAVALLLVLLLSFSIAKTITQPINRMKAAMVTLGAGGYPEDISGRSSGEMQELMNGFNTMVGDIRRLNEDLVEQQKKEKEYEVALVQNQLDLLQLQINPHFIHNTLNSMKYMALTAHNDELAQTIAAFNALLRASMSSSGAMASVMEEVENTQNYLQLQRGRYEFEIRFSYTAKEEVSFALLPKLILQPIVENSLFHGIAPADGGAIALHFEKRENRLVVTVQDDGVGISKERQAQMMSGELVNQRSYSHIGLANVNKRLELLYGPASTLRVESGEGRGTTVSFSIPFCT